MGMPLRPDAYRLAYYALFVNLFYSYLFFYKFFSRFYIYISLKWLKEGSGSALLWGVELAARQTGRGGIHTQPPRLTVNSQTVQEGTSTLCSSNISKVRFTSWPIFCGVGIARVPSAGGVLIISAQHTADAFKQVAAELL